MLFGLYANELELDSNAISSKLTRLARRYEHQHVVEVYTSSKVALFSLKKNTLNNDYLVIDINPGEHAWVSNAGYNAKNVDFIRRKITNFNWEEPLEIDGFWNAIYWNENTNIFRIATDWFGIAWMYVGKIAGGFVFSNDFGLITELSLSPLILNEGAVISELVFGYVPDEQTIFENVSLLPAGAVFELNKKGLTKISQRSFNYGNKYQTLNDEEKFEILDSYYARIVDHVFVSSQNNMLLSLSGGYDSRFALALLDKAGIKIPCFTFGNIDSIEVEMAIYIAEQVSLKTTVFSIPDADWSVWVRCIQQLGNTGMLQWSGWAEMWLKLLRENGNSVLIGYYGDALSGKHLVKSNGNSAAGWLEHWISWSKEDWSQSSLLSVDALSNANEIIKFGFQRLSAGINFEYPHQEAMHYDFFGRQRRWVAGQPNLINRFISPICYFCDAELADFWMNLPFSDLENQRLYLAYGFSRFPHLFDSNAIKSERMDVMNKILRRFSSLFYPKNFLQKPPPINRHDIVLHNKSNIIAIAEQSSFPIDKIINISNFVNLVKNYGKTGFTTNENNVFIMRITNLLILLDKK